MPLAAETTQPRPDQDLILGPWGSKPVFVRHPLSFRTPCHCMRVIFRPLCSLVLGLFQLGLCPAQPLLQVLPFLEGSPGHIPGLKATESRNLSRLQLRGEKESP